MGSLIFDTMCHLLWFVNLNVDCAFESLDIFKAKKIGGNTWLIFF